MAMGEGLAAWNPVPGMDSLLYRAREEGPGMRGVPARPGCRGFAWFPCIDRAIALSPGAEATVPRAHLSAAAAGWLQKSGPCAPDLTGTAAPAALRATRVQSSS
jgi:hypothetical protein